MTGDQASRSVTFGVLALAAAALVAARTRFHGIDTSPDSANYLAAARGLARGDGVVGVSGEPMSVLAPGLPTILALPARWGDPVQFAHWLNLAICAAVVLSVGLWSARFLRFPVAVVLTALAALSPPLLWISGWLWSEPPYVLLSLVLLVLLVRILHEAPERNAGLVVATGLVAAAATLTRYAGAGLALTAVVLLLLCRGTAVRRLQRVAVFSVSYSVPVGAWLARNVVVTGTAFGERVPSERGLLPNLESGFLTVSAWVAPSSPAVLSRLGLLLLVGTTIGLFALALPRLPARGDRRVSLLLALSVHLVVNACFLVVTASATSIDALDDRLLAPLALPLLLLLATVGDLALDHGARRRAVVLGVTAATLIGASSMGVAAARSTAPQALAPTYSDPRWEAEPFRALLSALPAEAIVVSNDPYAVSYVGDRPARESPRSARSVGAPLSESDLQELDALTERGPVYLLWLPDPGGSYVSPDQLDEVVALLEVARSPAGTVYEVSGR